MTLDENEVASRCLHGHPMPPALSRLRAARKTGDLDFLELLDSFDPAEEGYGVANAASEDVAANCRAHRRMFERLGFFARTRGDLLLALDLTSANVDDPPVAELDTEGEYSWAGRNIADALFKEGERSLERHAWLARHGLVGQEPGAVGASTQFLPGLDDLHKRYYAEERGRVPEPPVVRQTPAHRSDAITWIGRSGSEVEAILRELLTLGPAPFAKQWVRCDADGNVATVWLRRADAPSDLTAAGLPFVAKRNDVRALLGVPEKGREAWDGFTVDGVAVNVAYRNDDVDMITLMSRWPG